MEDIIIRIKGDPKDIDKLATDLKKLGKADDDNAKTFKANNQKFKDEVKSSGKELSGFQSIASKVGPAIAAVFTVGAVIGFGKAIIATRAEFQKFAAVLENTLGSKSAAQLALAQIQEFAAKTPFSVQELTASFVKLANQGFRPTTEQMRQLGDLAASTGKSFDQLTEGIIDAQTGQFERLKEFGIRAQKEGDKVTFTFKGVQTQTDFTSESIQKYILSLGDAVGVSGSMEAISKTLGGQISNLGDSWDNLLNILGSRTEGVIGNTITLLSSLVTTFANSLKTVEEIRADENLKGQAEAAKEAAKEFIEYAKSLKIAEDDVKGLTDASVSFIQARQDQIDKAKKLFDQGKAERELTLDKIQGNEAEIKAVNDYIESIQKKIEKDEADLKTKNKTKTGLEILTERLKALSEELQNQALTGKINNKTLEDYNRLLSKAKEASDLFQDSTSKLTFAPPIDKVDSILQEVKDKYKQLAEDNKKIEDESIEESIRKQGEAAQAKIDLAQQEADDKKRISKEFAAQEKEINTKSLELVSNISQISLNNELSNLDAQLKNKVISQEKYEEEVKRVKREAAQRDKDIALFQAIIAGAEAVVKALTAGPGIGQILAVLTAGLAATEIALIASQPIPQFAKGTDFLKRGRNKSGVDTIPIMANEGEAIIPTDKNKEAPGLAKAWIDGRLKDYVNLNYVVPAIKMKNVGREQYDDKFIDKLAKSIILNQKGFYDGNLLESDKQSRNILREQNELLRRMVHGRRVKARDLL